MVAANNLRTIHTPATNGHKCVLSGWFGDLSLAHPSHLSVLAGQMQSVRLGVREATTIGPCAGAHRILVVLCTFQPRRGLARGVGIADAPAAAPAVASMHPLVNTL
jgi:hypothetical protein